MRIGFTGTREGMNEHQKEGLKKFLSNLEGDKVHHFHHGDCVGADAEAHDIADYEGFTMVIHPPIKSAMRAFKDGQENREPKQYLERNMDIVDECDILVVAPSGNSEQLRSGTWATYRYARKKGKPVITLWRQE